MTASGLAGVVAAEIRAEQARQRLSGTQLATRMGKPNSTVNRWLIGEKTIGLDEIALFAEALGVSPMNWITIAFGPGPIPAPGLTASSGWRTHRPLMRLVRTARHSIEAAA